MYILFEYFFLGDKENTKIDKKYFILLMIVVIIPIFDYGFIEAEMFFVFLIQLYIEARKKIGDLNKITYFKNKLSKNNKEINISNIVEGRYLKSKYVRKWLILHSNDEESLNSVKMELNNLNSNDTIKFKENVLACVNHYRFEDDSRAALISTFLVAIVFVAMEKVLETFFTNDLGITNNLGILAADAILFIIIYCTINFLTFRKEQHSIRYYRLLVFIENL